MALFKSQLLDQASGSVGGLNFARCRAGSYIRGKAKHINTATPRQHFYRGIVSQLTHRWTNDLTPAQRDAWNIYSANTLLPGPPGDMRNVGGRGMYLRGNLGRVHAALGVQDDAPQVFDLDSFGTATHVSAASAFDDVRVGFDNTLPWANETGSAILIYVAPPQNASRNFLAGPFRFQTTIPGSGVFPPSSPRTFAFGHPLASGQRIFYRLVMTRLDGRFTASQTLTGLVA